MSGPTRHSGCCTHSSLCVTGNEGSYVAVCPDCGLGGPPRARPEGARHAMLSASTRRRRAGEGRDCGEERS